MLKPNEKICINCVLCHTAEDSYADGESLNQSRSWTHRDLQMDRTVGYAAVGEALAAVCMFNFLDKDWLAKITSLQGVIQASLKFF